MTIINSKPLSVRDLILSQLDRMDVDFYLTGSQRFGNVTEASDYDLFTQYSSNTIDKLELIGFVTHDSERPYSDGDCECVLKHYSAGIDIQLRHDVDTYERICRFLDTHSRVRYDLNKFPKESRHFFWDVLLAFSKF